MFGCLSHTVTLLFFYFFKEYNIIQFPLDHKFLLFYAVDINNVDDFLFVKGTSFQKPET